MLWCQAPRELGRAHAPVVTARVSGAQIKREGMTHLVVIPLYPQFSISTSGSSLRLLEAMFERDPALSGLKHSVIASWWGLAHMLLLVPPKTQCAPLLWGATPVISHGCS